GLEVAMHVAPLVPIALGKSVREAATRAKVAIPFADKREPSLLVLAPGDRAPRPAPRALVSGRAVDGHAGFDAGFAWANAADRTQLLGWIEATGAREVYVTGACAASVAGALGARGRVLGPPTQMTMFGDAR
ncbi:MAG: hypothetical protein NT062_01130, partial [Proteobacteria bacterium]|nr:hypothetical protein [Pseudomonadota bacterium]